MTLVPGWPGATPLRALLLLMLAQLLLWTLAPAFLFRSPPLDVAENIVWAREWQLGYYKHPPLQAWATGLALLAGGGVWAVYLLSQLCILGTWAGLYLLGRDAGGGSAGLTAVLIHALSWYATVPTPEFNANVVQMPVWSLAGWMLWRALGSGGRGWWAGLGVLLGLGILAKYSVVFLGIALAGAALALPQGRRAVLTGGPWIAVGVALLVALPHLVWLAGSGFRPITYALGRSERLEGVARVIGPLRFLLTQVIDHAAPLLLLALSRTRWTLPEGGAGRRYADLLAVLPLGLMAGFSLATGGALKDMWGAPAAIWISLALALRLAALPDARRIGLARALWLALFLIAPLATGLASKLGEAGGCRPKTAWPGPALAADLSARFREATDLPLAIVAGPTWEAGLIASLAPSRPSGFLGGDLADNPWITPERLAREGALFVWRGDGAEWARFGPFAGTGEIVLSPDCRLNWAALGRRMTP